MIRRRDSWQGLAVRRRWPLGTYAQQRPLSNASQN
jgi:hypothetical protein